VLAHSTHRQADNRGAFLKWMQALIIVATAFEVRHSDGRDASTAKAQPSTRSATYDRQNKSAQLQVRPDADWSRRTWMIFGMRGHVAIADGEFVMLAQLHMHRYPSARARRRGVRLPQHFHQMERWPSPSLGSAPEFASIGIDAAKPPCH